MEDRFYAEEAEKVQALDSGAKDFNQKLCEILGAECEEVADAEDIVWRKERLERLKQYTADPEILDKVDFVAFDQDDLEDIAREEDTNVVYLCGSKFRFPSGILRKKGVRYIGIGKKVTAKIESVEFVDLAALNISFDNVEVEGNYNHVGKKIVENEAVYTETNENMSEDEEIKVDEGDEDYYYWPNDEISLKVRDVIVGNLLVDEEEFELEDYIRNIGYNIGEKELSDIISELEDYYDIEIDEDDAEDLLNGTVGGLISYLKAMLNCSIDKYRIPI